MSLNEFCPVPFCTVKSRKNPAFLQLKKTGLIPCYHFFSSIPRGKDLGECRSALLRCKGRTRRSLLHPWCRSVRCSEAIFVCLPPVPLSTACRSPGVSQSSRNFSVGSPTDYSLRRRFSRYFRFFRSVKKVSTGAGGCQAPQVPLPPAIRCLCYISPLTAARMRTRRAGALQSRTSC